MQFRLVRAGRTFFKPGTVGAPYLGQPLACYGVLQDGESELRATTNGAEKTCRAMDRVPLEDQESAEAWIQYVLDGRFEHHDGSKVFEVAPGRLGLDDFLELVPAHFTVGFAEDGAYEAAAGVINSAFRELGVRLGEPESNK